MLGCCPIAATAAISATVAILATLFSTAGGSSSEESLRQALVLINILKSGIFRRTHNSSPAWTGIPAEDAGYKPWPPPHYQYLSDADKGESARRSNKATRQMEYDDPFGPPPENKETDKSTKGPSALQTDQKETSKSARNTTISVTTKSKSTKKPVPTTKTSINVKVTTKSVKKVKTNAPEPLKTTECPKTPTKSSAGYSIVSIKSTLTTKNVEINSTMKLKSSLVTNDTLKLNLIQGNITSKDATNANAANVTEEPEVVQAAKELQREAADTGGFVQHSFATKALKTGATSTKGNHAPPLVKPRYTGATRVYLARSFRPPIPLPANNAFCYTNPTNALCRTFI